MKSSSLIEEAALNPGMNITEDLLQNCPNDWDLAECFDDLGDLTEAIQCSQDREIGQDQSQFNQDTSDMVLNSDNQYGARCKHRLSDSATSDNNLLQSDAVPATQSQAQKQSGRTTMEQNIGTHTSSQEPSHRPTASSSRSFSNPNGDGYAPDCTRGPYDLGSPEEAGHPRRRSRNCPSLGLPSSEDIGRPEGTIDIGSRSQYFEHHKNGNASRHRTRTSSISSSKEHPSMFSYKEKLLTRGNKLFSDLSQLYKFGVELDMIQFDERFTEDLATIKARFEELSDLSRMDINENCNEYSDRNRANLGQNVNASFSNDRRLTEAHRHHPEINPSNLTSRAATANVIYQENNSSRYRQDVPQGQGISRPPIRHTSPRLTTSMINESEGGSSFEMSRGIRRMQEYRQENGRQAGHRREK
ncbi:hypothetical protein FPHYL_4174 [Fusarium phyllophilum]|uniref:Uncharacterized protein n=1 Tax=Fusarium phyllophilum TaxID=47803 RepID=A0A8H5K3L0_9HYPO|nr:hypothetical protein FPHYL_4174 [Fusarium phyllophilum]